MLKTSVVVKNLMNSKDLLSLRRDGLTGEERTSPLEHFRWSGRDQLFANGVQNNFCSGVQIELFHDVRAMRFNRVHT